MSNAPKSAATKRNNRKIHARKFLATPEHRLLILLVHTSTLSNQGNLSKDVLSRQKHTGLMIGQ